MYYTSILSFRIPKLEVWRMHAVILSERWVNCNPPPSMAQLLTLTAGAFHSSASNIKNICTNLWHFDANMKRFWNANKNQSTYFEEEVAQIMISKKRGLDFSSTQCVFAKIKISSEKSFKQALGNIRNTLLGNTYFTFRKIRIVKWVDIFVGWTIPGSVLRDKESFLRQLTNCSHQVSITLRLISKKVNSIPFISKFLSGQFILITTEHTKYKLLVPK